MIPEEGAADDFRDSRLQVFSTTLGVQQDGNMLFHKTETEKADLLGIRLGGGATETASVILEELGKRFNERLSDRDNASQFIIEVIVFYMHLVDRFAFAHFGATKRALFGDRFVIAVAKSVRLELSTVRWTPSFGQNFACP